MAIEVHNGANLFVRRWNSIALLRVDRPNIMKHKTRRPIDAVTCSNQLMTWRVQQDKPQRTIRKVAAYCSCDWRRLMTRTYHTNELSTLARKPLSFVLFDLLQRFMSTNRDDCTIWRQHEAHCALSSYTLMQRSSSTRQLCKSETARMFEYVRMKPMPIYCMSHWHRIFINQINCIMSY
jgi:hypothetical protein